MVSEKKTYHHGDLRHTLLKVSQKHVKKSGMANLSLRDLALQVGVSHTAPYRHFQDKEELLANLAKLGYEELSQNLNDLIDKHHHDPKRQLIEFGISYVIHNIDNPETSQLMFSGIISKGYRQDLVNPAAKSIFLILVNIVENGQKRGIFKRAIASELALGIWAIVNGITMLITNGQIGEDIKDRDELCQMIRRIINLNLTGIVRH